MPFIAQLCYCLFNSFELKKRWRLINHTILDYQWEIFIGLEILGFSALILFGVFRYLFKKINLSKAFILSFVLFIAIEAVLAWYVFNQTGEISSFQIIVCIFVLYAITFGWNDFKKLDRWMRKKIDADNLLTEADYEAIEKQKDPRYQAKYYLATWFIHVLVFLAVQGLFFYLSGLTWEQAQTYLTNFDWIESESYHTTPYSNSSFHSISMIWGIVLVVDTIVAATYVFQKKDK
ncbi:hypothetical protein [Gracilibacillus alcaliphilus]|uniref:hypothetical protein n=1 Tax=Gracilibacillus alcaliphilus TaxID=1401441 RepID=UPI00195BE20E|nr:hypothetical protein [Gracilibacillus alcaliphilus]MBM7675310.1 hypothetical protein [Gracilibacillus alcaliphilus]